MNLFLIAWVVGFILWIAETAYFGFNATPQSDLERFADGIAWALMVFGGLGLFIVTAVKYGLTEFERITNERSKRVIDEMKAEADRLTNFRVADTNRRKEDLDRATEIFKEVAAQAVAQGGFVPKLEEDEHEEDCMANEGMMPSVIREHHERFHCKEHKTGEPHQGIPIKIEVHEITMENEEAKPETEAPKPETKPAGKGKQSKK